MILVEHIYTIPRWQGLKNIWRIYEDPTSVIEEVMAQHGDTYQFYFGAKTMGLMTKDKDIVQYVLQKNHKNYIKSSIQTETLGRFLGNGLLTNDGASWQRQRRLIQPVFSKTNMEHWIDLIQTSVDEMLSEHLSENTTIDLLPFCAEMTFRIINKVLFTDPIPREELEEMRTIIEEIQEHMVRLIRQPFLKSYLKWIGTDGKRIKQSQRIKELLNNQIEKRLKSSANYQDMLQFLMDCRYEDTGHVMDRKQLIDEVLILMIAGHETTALAMMWTLLLLSRNTAYLEAIRSEENLGKGTILEASINESMRLYPPAWIIDRKAIEPDTFEHIRIDNTTIVGLYIYGLHRNEAYWENPLQYKPERFIEGNYMQDAFVPFGRGPRMCIGSHFAMLELQMVIQSLAYNFDFVDTQAEMPKVKPYVTLYPDRKVRMAFKKRNYSA